MVPAFDPDIDSFPTMNVTVRGADFETTAYHRLVSIYPYLLRPVVEKLVTIARSDSEHHRNLVMSKIDHPPATTKLFEVIAPRFETAPGGYTRISKLGVRHGDAAPMALIEFIEV